MNNQLTASRFLIASAVVAIIHFTGALPGWSFDQTIPAACPIPRSTDITSITITDLHRTYDGGADTWFPVWDAKGNGYSPFMDGLGANGNWQGKVPAHSLLGFALISGDDPLKLAVKKTSVVEETDDYEAAPGPLGRYGCTVLPYKGVLYYGSSYRLIVNDYHFLRPFAGFDISTDGGTTWTKRSGKLFPEAEYPDIKIGEPHFVDFGPELKNSPDGKAYLVAFGADPKLAATRPKQTKMPSLPPENPHWSWGDCVYLLRVTPSPETINDASKYEYYAGNDAAGKAIWTHDFSQIKPVVEWADNMGQAAATYVPALKKYIMSVTDGHTYSGSYNTYFLESNELTGPWHMVSYWGAFGKQAYFTNLPSKFLDPTVKDGALMAWIVYSANFMNNPVDPPDSRYAMCLRQISIKLPAKAVGESAPTQNPPQAPAIPKSSN
jgi:hypothetical protein